MTLIESMGPACEVYSIDEAFADLTGVPGDLEALGRAISRKVYRCTGIPIGVGIAKTRTLAKLAITRLSAFRPIQVAWWICATRSNAIGCCAIPQ